MDLSVRKSERSHKSKSSKSKKSHKRAASSILTRKLAKVELAKVNSEYALREAKLLEERAKIQAEEEIRLKAEKDKIAAEAELLAARSQLGDIHSQSDHSDDSTSSDSTSSQVQQESVSRTKQYVTDQNNLLASANQKCDVPLNSGADSFAPGHVVVSDSNAPMSDVLRYIMRKDVVMSRLYRFDEKAESYISWKSTFKDVMHEISAQPPEEMDLLVKWLGQKSSQQVIQIRNSNVHDLTYGLCKAWDRLDLLFGSVEKIERAMSEKLKRLPNITLDPKDKLKFYEFSDAVNEVLSLKENKKFSNVLSYFDTPKGVNPILVKLPVYIRNRWRTRASSYKRDNAVLYPPLYEFAAFMKETAEMMNDLSFEFEDSEVSSSHRKKEQRVFVKQTNVHTIRCPIHRASHALKDCMTFASKPCSQKHDYLKEHGLCFRCLEENHRVKHCKAVVSCDTCKSKRHLTVMHDPDYKLAGRNYGGEQDVTRPNVTESDDQTRPKVAESGSRRILSKCTEVCEKSFTGKSCAKIIQVTVAHVNSRHEPTPIYAIIDEQSNKTVGSPVLFDKYDPFCPTEEFVLSTCNGNVTTSGRISTGFTIESLDRSVCLSIPSVIECDTIPHNRHEIPTPEVVLQYPHLANLRDLIPPLNDSADILLLIGRDVLSAHHVHEQIIGRPNEPFAQRLSLGWFVIGDTCLNGTHKPVTVMKTSVTVPDSQQSIFTPCHSKMRIKIPEYSSEDGSIFQVTENDQSLSMSIEDKAFVVLMDKEMSKDPSGNWIAPLPFKPNRPRLPNNRAQALDRAYSLDRSLRRDSVKRAHFLEFMDGLIKARHAEPAPPIDSTEECWFLPLFGIYHPQKRDRIRGVFDASAKFRGTSLNNVLMTGPDLMNSLIGVLMRFRKEHVAIMADIGLMFYCFLVRKDHRRYLRFIWHEDNDLQKPLIDYHMNVHVFGNIPSPAVATYGLRRTANVAERKYGLDVRSFVHRNFYVDDALSSHTTSAEAIDLLTRTKSALMEYGNLRLHKISSNSEEVLSAFDGSELSKDLTNHELGGTLPTQRSLGMCWNLQDDKFVFRVSLNDRPYTRRGVLSSINSLFDPLGFVAPVLIEGKAILREAMTQGGDWDEPLTDAYRQRWDTWKSSLLGLESLRIPRTYSDTSLVGATRRDLYIYSDASQSAIASVAYIKVADSQGHQSIGFVIGKAKLAPKHGHTIPRLELCGAVLATELYMIIKSELDVTFDSVKFFTDSRVVLGYIMNDSKRFYTYVANRVERIRGRSNPSEWYYVASKLNPADEATRAVSAHDMQNSMWLNGPSEICSDPREPSEEEFPVYESDVEVRTLKTSVAPKAKSMDSKRFERFSVWTSLIRAIAVLKHISSGKCEQSSVWWHVCGLSRSPDVVNEAKHLVIATVQMDSFVREIDALQAEKPLPRDSSLRDLSPFIDPNGLLRVGGRLRNVDLDATQKNPIIIPKGHHIAKLIVAHYHKEVRHQGRTFTEGAVRTAGFWIIGCRRLINSYIQSCVLCKRTRGKHETPMMADLPADRLAPASPFTYIGVDVFGPWQIVTRKTRGGQANSKRWAVIFTCLVIRAIHIEILEEVSASSFINALRRFIALRGEVKLIRSDCGTNFIGAAKELKMNVIHAGDADVQDFLNKKGITWRYNAPHSSHMGGAWERDIGIARRILDSILTDVQNKHLTHEILVTLMAEVCSIVNSRPLGGVSADPQVPFPLTPSTLLTMKTNHTVESFRIDDFSYRDLFTRQWRCVQQLANRFWKRWKTEYLPTLQSRPKWQDDTRNLCVGDVVILKDKALHRNCWPLGVVVNAYPDEDSRIRKIDVRVAPDNKVYSRPACEVVLLVPHE